MSKRMSTTKLDHENWDVEEPPEEAGTFSSATTEVLKKRVILKAQRRSKLTSSGESATPAVPNIFRNIKLTGDSSAPPPSFSFLSKSASETPKTESPVSKPQSSFVFCSTTSTAEAPSKPGEAKFSFASTKPAPVTVSETPSVTTTSKSDASSTFEAPKSPASAPSVEMMTASKPEASSTFATLISPSSASAVEATGVTTNAFKTKKMIRSSAVTSTTDRTKPATPPLQSFGSIFGNSMSKSLSAELAREKAENRTDTGQFSFTSGAKKNEALAKYTNKPPSTENENKNADPPSPNGFIDKDKYYFMLKGLNNSVANWIKENVDKNPHSILTPIFSDYITHLNDIKAKYGKVRTGAVSEKNESVPTSVPVSSRDQDKEKAAPPSSFMVNGKDKEQGTKFILPFPPGSVPSLKAPLDKPQVSTPFSFSAFIPQKTSPKPETSTPSSLPAADKPAELTSSSSILQAAMESKSEKTEENDDDAEPPEPTPTPVVEEGAVYSKRCKVFVKKSGSYQDRGVGTAFIKPVVENTKTQLIVRADTVLGNVLLNTLISSAVPIQRLGSNNVAVVCVPTPDEKPPPTTVLLRVKTTADAEELYEKLSSYKK